MKSFILLTFFILGGCIQNGVKVGGTIEDLKLDMQNRANPVEPELWIEIHDISPGWKYWRLEQLINITEKHRGAFSKAVLFVIPNHANTTPLSAYPEYVQQLKSIEGRGYIIGMHGYTHPTPPFFEMNVSRDTAMALISGGLGEFEKGSFAAPRYFAPPGFVASPETASYLEAAFDYVYYSNTTKTPRGTKGYVSHEYTWYSTNASSAFENARRDYLEANEVFRLTIHLEAANNPDGLDFIDKFLAWVESRNS